MLALANCALLGMIPPWLQSFQSLNVLDISWNKLTGNIPPLLCNLNNLFYIDLSNNSFSEELPDSVTWMRSLTSGDSSGEQAPTENLPLFIKRNSSVSSLQYNKINSFPRSPILSNNLLVGPVLPGFGHLVKLHLLDLSWNNFSGPIPHELSGMSSLEVLNLAHNDLNGSIPSSLTELSFLSKFDVSYNNLAGDIPTWGQFSAFSDEDFAGNYALCSLSNSSCYQALRLEDEHHDMDTAKQFTYIMLEVGMAFGLLMVWSALYFARPWRSAYFRLVDRLFDAPCIWTVAKVTSLRIKRGNEVHP